MSIFGEYVRAAAEKKNLLPDEWLRNAASKAECCNFSTHVGRYSHPDVKTTWQAERNCCPDEPYVSTASADCALDVAVSAAYLPTINLLYLQLEDGRTFYEHLAEDDEVLRRDIEAFDVDYHALRDDFLSIGSYEIPKATDHRLYQVFFPVGNDDYHLLTVMPPSSVMQELKRRIVARNNQAYEDWKNGKESAYHRRLHIVQTKFGGTKVQNISFVNNSMGGRLYMLESLPPILKKRDVVYPRNDFFMDVLRLREFRGLFYRLHGRYKDGRHNKEIRQSVRDVEAQIMERVLLHVYDLRQGPDGWSDCRHISTAQAIWLDDKHADLRQKMSWRQEIADSFAAWFMNSYRLVMKQKAVELGDGEFKALSAEVKEFIADDIRNQ